MPTVRQETGYQTRAGQRQVLSGIDAGVIGTAMTARLYKSSFSPSSLSVIADFLAAEADYDGYAGIALATWTPGVDSAGMPILSSEEVDFQNTDGSVPNSLGGVFTTVVVSSGPTVTIGYNYYPFTSPVTMSAPGQIISASITYNGNSLAGTATVEV